MSQKLFAALRVRGTQTLRVPGQATSPSRRTLALLTPSSPFLLAGLGCAEPRLASLSFFLQSLSSSPQAQPPRPAELSDEEVAELFQRLAETQQEKWMLEEKVLSACSAPLEVFWWAVRWRSGWVLCYGQTCIVGRPKVGWAILQVKHLEVSSASMAEDLCRKSAIIETYVMDSRIGQCPLPSPHPLSPPAFIVSTLWLFPSWNSTKLLTRPQPPKGRAGSSVFVSPALSLCGSVLSLSIL